MEENWKFLHASKVFQISIYVSEFIEDENKFRILYNFNSEDNFLSYCMILNHKLLESGAEHFNLLKINNNFDYNILNSIDDKAKFKLLDINKNNNHNNEPKHLVKHNYINDKIKSTKININNNEDSSEQTDNNKIDSENISYNSSNNSSLEINHKNNNFIIDEFTEIHEKIKELIKSNNDYNDLILNEIVGLAKSIQYQNYYNIYNGDNYYLDKYLYLLSSKLLDKLRL